MDIYIIDQRMLVSPQALTQPHQALTTLRQLFIQVLDALYLRSIINTSLPIQQNKNFSLLWVTDYHIQWLLSMPSPLHISVLKQYILHDSFNFFLSPPHPSRLLPLSTLFATPDLLAGRIGFNKNTNLTIALPTTTQLPHLDHHSAHITSPRSNTTTKTPTNSSQQYTNVDNQYKNDHTHTYPTITLDLICQELIRYIIAIRTECPYFNPTPQSHGVHGKPIKQNDSQYFSYQRTFHITFLGLELTTTLSRDLDLHLPIQLRSTSQTNTQNHNDIKSDSNKNSILSPFTPNIYRMTQPDLSTTTTTLQSNAHATHLTNRTGSSTLFPIQDTNNSGLNFTMNQNDNVNIVNGSNDENTMFQSDDIYMSDFDYNQEYIDNYDDLDNIDEYDDARDQSFNCIDNNSLGTESGLDPYPPPPTLPAFSSSSHHPSTNTQMTQHQKTNYNSPKPASLPAAKKSSFYSSEQPILPSSYMKLFNGFSYINFHQITVNSSLFAANDCGNDLLATTTQSNLLIDSQATLPSNNNTFNTDPISSFADHQRRLRLIYTTIEDLSRHFPTNTLTTIDLDEVNELLLSPVQFYKPNIVRIDFKHILHLLILEQKSQGTQNTKSFFDENRTHSTLETDGIDLLVPNSNQNLKNNNQNITVPPFSEDFIDIITNFNNNPPIPLPSAQITTSTCHPGAVVYPSLHSQQLSQSDTKLTTTINYCSCGTKLKQSDITTSTTLIGPGSTLSTTPRVQQYMRQQHSNSLSCAQCILDLNHPVESLQNKKPSNSHDYNENTESCRYISDKTSRKYRKPYYPMLSQSLPFYNPSDLLLTPSIYSPTLNATVLGKVNLDEYFGNVDVSKEHRHQSPFSISFTQANSKLLSFARSLPQSQPIPCYSPLSIPLFDLHGIYYGQSPQLPIPRHPNTPPIPEKLLVCSNSRSSTQSNNRSKSLYNMSDNTEGRDHYQHTTLGSSLKHCVQKNGCLPLISELFDNTTPSNPSLQLNDNHKSLHEQKPQAKWTSSCIGSEYDYDNTHHNNTNTSLCTCLKCHTYRNSKRLLQFTSYLHTNNTGIILSCNFTSSTTSTSSFHEPIIGSSTATTHCSYNFNPQIGYFPIETRYLAYSPDGIQLVLEYIPSTEELLLYQFHNRAGLRFNEQCQQYKHLHHSALNLSNDSLSNKTSPTRHNSLVLDDVGDSKSTIHSRNTITSPTLDSEQINGRIDPFSFFISKNDYIPSLSINDVIYSSNAFDLIDTHIQSSLRVYQQNCQNNPRLIPPINTINTPFDSVFHNENDDESSTLPLLYLYGQNVTKHTSNHKTNQSLQLSNIADSNNNKIGTFNNETLLHSDPIHYPLGHYYPPQLGLQTFNRNVVNTLPPRDVMNSPVSEQPVSSRQKTNKTNDSFVNDVTGTIRNENLKKSSKMAKKIHTKDDLNNPSHNNSTSNNSTGHSRRKNLNKTESIIESDEIDETIPPKPQPPAPVRNHTLSSDKQPTLSSKQPSKVVTGPSERGKQAYLQLFKGKNPSTIQSSQPAPTLISPNTTKHTDLSIELGPTLSKNDPAIKSPTTLHSSQTIEQGEDQALSLADLNALASIVSANATNNDNTNSSHSLVLDDISRQKQELIDNQVESAILAPTKYANSKFLNSTNLYQKNKQALLVDTSRAQPQQTMVDVDDFSDDSTDDDLSIDNARQKSLKDCIEQRRGGRDGIVSPTKINSQTLPTKRRANLSRCLDVGDDVDDDQDDENNDSDDILAIELMSPIRKSSNTKTKALKSPTKVPQTTLALKPAVNKSIFNKINGYSSSGLKPKIPTKSIFSGQKTDKDISLSDLAGTDNDIDNDISPLQNKGGSSQTSTRLSITTTTTMTKNTTFLISNPTNRGDSQNLDQLDQDNENFTDADYKYDTTENNPINLHQSQMLISQLSPTQSSLTQRSYHNPTQLLSEYTLANKKNMLTSPVSQAGMMDDFIHFDNNSQ